MSEIRHDWTSEELQELYDLPLMKLISKAHAIHSCYHNQQEIQVCHLISIKTGGCPENCKYCAQSSYYQTEVAAQRPLSYEEVYQMAKRAIDQGVTRICLGAAWRNIRDGKSFDQVLQMIKDIAGLGVEVCCTLGMLKEHQAQQLKEAGLCAYNHNLDTSEAFYPQIITTRTYQDRLQTLDIIEKTGIQVCCGGILGMGESINDRLDLLLTLSRRSTHPESVPINRLSPVPGTPLENQAIVSFWEMLRIIAVARIVMPQSQVRLAAGRINMSHEQHALCFFAGANSIFFGERMLTVAVANTPIDQDEEMFQILGLKKRTAASQTYAKA